MSLQGHTQDQPTPEQKYFLKVFELATNDLRSQSVDAANQAFVQALRAGMFASLYRWNASIMEANSAGVRAEHEKAKAAWEADRAKLLAEHARVVAEIRAHPGSSATFPGSPASPQAPGTPSSPQTPQKEPNVDVLARELGL